MARNKKPVDPNAPHRPCSSFLLFMRYRLTQSNDFLSRPLGERNRMIGAEWAALPQTEKSIYNEQAANERERYKTNFEAYKHTQQYKDWLSEQETVKVSPTSKIGRKSLKGKRANDVKDEDSSLPKTPRVSIFTYEFLEYNRQKEMSLRNLRKQATQLEEETALLSKHVENLGNAGIKLAQQIKAAEAQLATEEALVQKFRKELVNTFADLAVPTQDILQTSPSITKGSERITVSSVDCYLTRLAELMTRKNRGSEEEEALKERALDLLKTAIRSKTLTLCSV